MRLVLFTFGKLKTPGLRETADHFLKRIQPWIGIDEVELRPLPVADKADRKQIQIKEGSLLLEKIDATFSSRDTFYLLDETGKAMRTQDWVALAQGWERESFPQVGLCIGSSLGFAPEVRKRARGTLSLGPQTLSHELARVVLLEQTYRTWSVMKGHPYHNEGS